MPVTSLAEGRKAIRYWIILGLAVLALTALGLDIALAQGNPFGGPRPAAPPAGQPTP